MEKTPLDMIEILPDQEHAVAKAFIDLGSKLKCRSAVRFASAHKSWKCVFSRTKPSRVLFTVECTQEKWSVKACLWNIDAFRDVLDICGSAIKESIVNAYSCKLCSDHCKGGAGFTLDNVFYRKCIGCCFYFSNMCKEDWDNLLMLIEHEYRASGSA